MAKPKRVVGLPNGAANLETQEVFFTLSISPERRMECVAKAGVAEQIISALASMCAKLREAAIESGTIRPTSAETVTASMVQRERLHDVVLLQLVTDRNVPHTFALSREAAIDIAARLKTESERDVSLGSA